MAKCRRCNRRKKKLRAAKQAKAILETETETETETEAALAASKDDALLLDVAMSLSILTNADMEEMGPGFIPETQVKSITPGHIVCIHQLFCQPKIDDPSGDCLIPSGDDNLRRCITNELKPDMVETYSPSAQFEGHPFIVEAAVSLGGKIGKQGFNIFCFANGIRLQCEQGADFFTRTAINMIKWKRYKINKTEDKIGVFVNFLTKIPLNGTEKEYSGDDTSKIVSTAVETSIRRCCRKLKVKIQDCRLEKMIENLYKSIEPSVDVICNHNRKSKGWDAFKLAEEREKLIQKFRHAADLEVARFNGKRAKNGKRAEMVLS